MGNFRQGGNNRGSFNRGGRSSGRFGGGFGGRRNDFRGRDSGDFDRRRPEMHEVTCDKCGKQCEVPFKPTGGKPIFCSECFRNSGDSNAGSRNRSGQSEASSEQIAQINAKLDKILEILQDLEIVEDEELDEEDVNNDLKDDSK